MVPTVCLLTDFGNSNAYAGIMKGVLFSLCPKIRLIDLTHDIPPQDVLSAAYHLYSAWDYFPKKTIFVCVVDPGVGSGRKELVAYDQGKYLVCPDNGVISLLIRRKKEINCRELKRDPIERIAKNPISNTFQGRDIFAPAAALIGKQRYKALLGPSIIPYLIPEVFPEIIAATNALKGKILHIDRFGNCISSIHISEVSGKAYKECVGIKSAGMEITRISRTFSDVAEGEVLAYWGSSGFLEIAVRNGHAASKLGLSRLDEIILD
jgi:S-adenosylmethionine hydrolase